MTCLSYSLFISIIKPQKAGMVVCLEQTTIGTVQQLEVISFTSKYCFFWNFSLGIPEIRSSRM